jgi:hypothetical protein
VSSVAALRKVLTLPSAAFVLTRGLVNPGPVSGAGAAAFGNVLDADACWTNHWSGVLVWSGAAKYSVALNAVGVLGPLLAAT